MNKYRATRTVVDGLTFDSKAEARRWQELKLLERAGEIERLERQVRFKLPVNGADCGTYVADFVYFDVRRKARVVEDMKSPATAKLPMFRLKAKLMKAIHGVVVEVVS